MVCCCLCAVLALFLDGRSRRSASTARMRRSLLITNLNLPRRIRPWSSHNGRQVIAAGRYQSNSLLEPEISHCARVRAVSIFVSPPRLTDGAVAVQLSTQPWLAGEQWMTTELSRLRQLNRRITASLHNTGP